MFSRDGYSRNILCDVLFPQFIQPSGSPATEVMTFSLPPYCLSWLPAVAHYLRQNLLIFLHVPKYTDSNTAHHFKVPAVAQKEGQGGCLHACVDGSPGSPASSHSLTGLRCGCGWLLLTLLETWPGCALPLVPSQLGFQTQLCTFSRSRTWRICLFLAALNLGSFSTSLRSVRNAQTLVVFCTMSISTKLSKSAGFPPAEPPSISAQQQLRVVFRHRPAVPEDIWLEKNRRASFILYVLRV